jgi:tetratricopeptide (TPR) repeat protein
VAGGSTDPWAPALGTAAANRLQALLEAVPERRAFEDRLLALGRARLPWQAALLLADAVDSIARRRGDRALLAREAERAGCASQADLLGLRGRLPNVDLETPRAFAPYAVPVALQAIGCRLTVPAFEGYAGVRVLRPRLGSAPTSPSVVVLDFAGPARLRLSDGVARAHGSRARFGPQWSAWPLPRDGRGAPELSLGTYGGTSEVRLFVVPAARDAVAPRAGGAVAAAVSSYADALLAEAEGDTDRMIERLAALGQHRRFALGLALAAHLAGQDLTRPAGVARDEARRFLRRAVDLDPAQARTWRALALADLARDRPSDAIEHAERSRKAAPGWWPAELTLSEALKARGLERESERALARAVELARGAEGVCPVLTAAFRRAQQDHDVAAEERLARAIARCDGQSQLGYERARQRGETQAAVDALDHLLGFVAPGTWLSLERAALRLGRADARGAVADLLGFVAWAPRDATARLRLYDALVAAGDAAGAARTLNQAVATFPERPEVRQAARLRGVPLPLDGFRQDGRAVIRAFVASGRRHEAPATMILDRTVHRILPDGTELILTHNIVRVDTKDGIQRFGEVAVPETAEVLALRTHKPDGTIREPEEIAGKGTVSAPDLAVGDFVEWETLEQREPSLAFAPGFLGDRFYFQSLEAPLDLSEYVVIAPPSLGLEADRRAGAPAAIESGGPDGTRVLRFLARSVPQLFAERAAVPAIEWIPSVRVSSGVTVERWRRFLSERFVGSSRASLPVRTEAARLRSLGRGDPTLTAASIVRWITDRIEPEGDLLEPATSTLARGKGNRVGLALAMAREAGLRAELVVARPLGVAPATAPLVAQELDDFADVLVAFHTSPGRPPLLADLRLRRAPLGYVPPGLDGAPTLSPDTGLRATARTSLPEGRSVNVEITVSADGRGEGVVTEELTGWGALEWLELTEQAAGDSNKLRSEFEQRWLSQHFPGAELGQLETLSVEPWAARARVRYSFTAPRLGTRQGAELALSPTFFLNQPGRRYASEGRRRTALQLGAEIPLDLVATFTLPESARPQSLGAGIDVRTGPAGRIRYLERREVLPEVPGDARLRVRLQRQVRLPLLRVGADAYPGVALQLRRVDPAEEAELRFVLK